MDRQHLFINLICGDCDYNLPKYVTQLITLCDGDCDEANELGEVSYWLDYMCRQDITDLEGDALRETKEYGFLIESLYELGDKIYPELDLVKNR